MYFLLDLLLPTLVRIRPDVRSAPGPFTLDGVTHALMFPQSMRLLRLRRLLERRFRRDLHLTNNQNEAPKKGECGIFGQRMKRGRQEGGGTYNGTRVDDRVLGVVCELVVHVFFLLESGGGRMV